VRRAAVALVLVLSCGPRDGVVGYAGDPPVYLAEFEPGIPGWEEQVVAPDATTATGVRDDAARDGFVASLVFPGHADYAASDLTDARYATQIQSLDRFSFGTYRARVALGACSSDEEVVTAFLGYFNDGTDRDSDGITDDLEVDLQITCSTPTFAYLTVFTDYADTASGPVFRKLGRVVDFSNGELYDTPSDDSDSFERSGSDPALVKPDLFAPGVFREIGFEWQPDSIRFFVDIDGNDHELWQLTGRNHVPQQPLHLMFNLWHPEDHWFPRQGSADYPANDVVLTVDWVTVRAERLHE
jgi:hypothetical protein